MGRVLVAANPSAPPHTITEPPICRKLAALADARDAGVPVDAYFVWSLLDNFEWGEGYAHRFGIVHVDFVTQRRTMKVSGLWYRDLFRAPGSDGFPVQL